MFNTKLLRQARKESDLTQAVLATRIGISRETVVAIENGHVRTVDSLTFPTVRKWLETVNCKESTKLAIKSEALKELGF